MRCLIKAWAVFALVSGGAPALAETLAVDLFNAPGELTYTGSEWQFATQGLTFGAEGPLSVGDGRVYASDSVWVDEGPAWATIDAIPFAVRSVTFNLQRLRTGIYCDPFTSPQVCTTTNLINASVFDLTGALIGQLSSMEESSAFRFTSEIGIGRIYWDAYTPTDGRYFPYFGGGAALSDLVLSSEVPEPATWAMLLLGFGAIGWTERLRGRGGAGAGNGDRTRITSLEG